MTFKKTAFTAIATLLCLLSHAQSKNALWVEYYPDINIGRWTISPEIAYRSNDFNGTNVLYFRPAATYTINSYMAAAVSAAYFATWRDHTVRSHEIVTYQQMAFTMPTFARFTAGLNVRFEELFIKSDVAQDDFLFTLRLRLQPKVTYSLPFWEKKKLSVSVFAETFNHLASSKKNRFTNSVDWGGSFNFAPAPRLTMSLEYRYNEAYTHPDVFSNRFRIVVRHRIL